jgi:hypothetical protein
VQRVEEVGEEDNVNVGLKVLEVLPARLLRTEQKETMKVNNFFGVFLQTLIIDPLGPVP